jgi:maltooligosyltrehalose synthase
VIKYVWDDINIFVKKTVREARIGFSWPKTESDYEREIEITEIRKVWLFIGQPEG